MRLSSLFEGSYVEVQQIRLFAHRNKHKKIPELSRAFVRALEASCRSGASKFFDFQKDLQKELKGKKEVTCPSHCFCKEKRLRPVKVNEL
jgi:hypothetical protein